MESGFVLWVDLVLFFEDYNKYLRDYIPEIPSLSVMNLLKTLYVQCIVFGLGVSYLYFS